MAQYRPRRSSRIALSVPIRVFASDYRGVDFTEDTVTVVVNRHGAKIRLARQLLPEQEIRVISQSTQLDAVFRVVSKAAGSDTRFSYWGVENLDPRRNLWGVEIPLPEPEDQFTVRAQLQCPHCATRHWVRLSETWLAVLGEEGGVPRHCPSCHQPSLWKVVPFSQA